jgi:hypothetical protein
MAIVQQKPTEPTIAPNAGTLQPGLASDFRSRLNGYVGTVEDKAQLTQAFLEQTNAYLGNGWIKGGTVSAGAGLSVVITPFTAIVGNIIENDSSGTVGGLAANATNFIYLRQDGTWTTNTTGVVPGTADGHGTAVYWAQAITGASSVTSIVNYRLPFRWGLSRVSVGTVSGGTVIIAEKDYFKPTLEFFGTPTGTVNIHFPLAWGQQWTIHNQATPTIRCLVPGGTGVLIGSNKHAIIRCGSADILRVTPDT